MKQEPYRPLIRVIRAAFAAGMVGFFALPACADSMYLAYAPESLEANSLGATPLSHCEVQIPFQDISSAPGFSEPFSAPASVKMTLGGGTSGDIEMACGALKSAVNFWSRHIDPVKLAGSTVSIRFIDDMPAPALAFYSVIEKTILARRDMTGSMAGKKIFGLDATPTLTASILVHEMSHALTEHFYTDLDGVGVEDEYAAFVAQIESMGEGDRERVVEMSRMVIKTAPGSEQFDTLAYALHKQAFGLMAHRHFMSGQGGDEFLKKIFSKSFVAPRAMSN